MKGEEKAWMLLSELEPKDVCKRAGVIYCRESKSYILKSFGVDFSVAPFKKEIKCLSEKGEIFLKRLNYFFIISILTYLIHVKDIPLSKTLIKPENIKGGEFFFKGTHTLPLNKLAEKYQYDKEGFIKKGMEFDAKILDYGDVSIEFMVFPRIPVTLILWLSDEEFSARADLLFDSTSESQLPIDILWSIAMMSTLVML
jgi:hypothetical protein